MNIDEEANGSSISRFVVNFKQTCATFYVGDIIYGSAELELRESLVFRGVRAQFRGESYVYWQNRLSNGSCETVKEHQSFWNQLFTIWGKKVNEVGPDPILTRGHHKFPFAVRIPPSEMPSSFEHKNGAIRYWLKVYIDQKNYETNRYKPFTVLQNIDVNNKKYQSRISNDAEKTMCCSCFCSSSVSLSANLDRTGYCPGEQIAINCRGKNQARRDMGGIKARLVQKIIYTVGKHIKKEENILSAIGGNKIEKGRTKVWENQLLKIPAIPPTIEDFKNIAVHYQVQITMVVPKGIDLQFHLPITIGTIGRKVNNLNQKASIQFKRCTDGVECFNHSSKSYNFPLLAYMPTTAYVGDFLFVSYRTPSPDIHNQRQSSKKGKDEEKQSLLVPNSSMNTFRT